MDNSELHRELGNVDLFLLDQILKGRFSSGHSLLDLGSGEGRNLTYFLKNNFKVTALDRDGMALKMLGMYARTLANPMAGGQLIQAEADATGLADESMDNILSINVLHFARDNEHFESMMNEIFRILKPGGILVVKSNSNLGAEDRVVMSGQLYKLPEGDLRFFITRGEMGWILSQGFEFLEPPKWEIHDQQESWINLVLRKKS